MTQKGLILIILMFNKWLFKSYNNDLIVLFTKMTILYLIITNYI